MSEGLCLYENLADFGRVEGEASMRKGFCLHENLADFGCVAGEAFMN